MKKLIFTFSLYLLISWLLIGSYNFFVANLNENSTRQNQQLNKKINAIDSLKSAYSVPTIKNVEEYDKKHNTNLQSEIKNLKYICPAKGVNLNTLSEKLECVRQINIQKTLTTKSENFWNSIPRWSTILVATMSIIWARFINDRVYPKLEELTKIIISWFK